MRKQVGLKFDEEDIARWDTYAESHGLTRTTLIETAVERFISQAESQRTRADAEPARGPGAVHEPESQPAPESQQPQKYRSGPEMLALREKHLGWKYGPRESQERVSDKRS